MTALVVDRDGVLVDTECLGRRLAFDEMFDDSANGAGAAAAACIQA